MRANSNLTLTGYLCGAELSVAQIFVPWITSSLFFYNDALMELKRLKILML